MKQRLVKWFAVCLLLSAALFLVFRTKNGEVDFSEPVPAEHPLTDELIIDLEDYVRQVMAEDEIPGIAMVLVQGGSVVYAKGLGVRDLETREPLTTKTLMSIGSATKSMTAVMLATMVDEGVIDWKTPVTGVMPSFRLSDPEVTEKVTFEHMLCMCTGVPRRMEEISFRFADLSAEDIIESLASIPLRSAFGTQFNYSSRMLAAGGYLAALADGGAYGDLGNAYARAMQERLLGPLGMSETTFSIEEAAESGNFATPYYTGLGGAHAIPLSTEGIFRPIAPAGGLWSNADDLGKYLIMLLNEGVAASGERVVSAENLAYLWEPRAIQEPGLQYGLGWNIETFHGITIYHHPGGTVGFASELAVIPELDIGVALITNKLDLVAPVGRMAYYRLLEMLSGTAQTYDAKIADAKRETGTQIMGLKALTTVTVDPAAMEPFLGSYRNEALGEVSLVLHPDQTLWMDVGEYEIPLYSLRSNEHQYIFFESLFMGKTLSLDLDSGGNPEMAFTGDEGVPYVFKPVP